LYIFGKGLCYKYLTRKIVEINKKLNCLLERSTRTWWTVDPGLWITVRLCKNSPRPDLCGSVFRVSDVTVRPTRDVPFIQ